MKNECNITINVDVNNRSIPLFQQIAQGIEQNIAAGILKPGDMLPSSRILAQHLGVSRKTIVSASELLLSKGLITSQSRIGLFIAPPRKPDATALDASREDAHESIRDSISITVNDGFPDTRLLPFLEFTRTYRKLFNRAAQWKTLGYNSPIG